MNQKNPKCPFVRLMLVFVIVVIIGVGVNKLLTESGSGFFNTAEIAETKEKRQKTYTFRDEEHLLEQYEKHKDKFHYDTPEEYEEQANRVIHTFAVLHKQEKEGDDNIYYAVDTNELVVVSSDGYIRTYFKPEEGMKYYNKQ